MLLDHTLNFYQNSQSFLSTLVISSDKVIIVGDNSIHVDIDNDSLSTEFISLLDSVGFGPLDDCLIIFEFLLLDYTPLGKKMSLLGVYLILL